MLKTKDGRLLAVEKLSWNDAITAITPTNPNLTKVMRVLNDNDYAFYKASYRFGDKIISNGKCYLPLASGGSIAFDDLNLPDNLRTDLSYSNKEDPLGLILAKNSEFYLLGEDGVRIQSIIHPGQMFGIPKAIDDENNVSTSALTLNLNAGSRSLFMLSKIGNQAEHRKIQEHYQITLPAPSTPQGHWELFVDIANKANSSWRCEILFFSRKWIKQVKNDEWAAVAKRLNEIHRASYNIWHKVSDVWNQIFHEVERDKKFSKHYSMQSISIAKQLFLLAGNIAHGFIPATAEDGAPIKLITDAYTNVYNKLVEQEHCAIVMEAAKFNINSKYPIYYSINHSNTTQDELEASKLKSQIARLDEIRRIEEGYTKAILDPKNSATSLYEITKNTTFSYYHLNNLESYDKLKSSDLIASEDNRFTNGESKIFPTNSLFFRGCIKISRVF